MSPGSVKRSMKNLGSWGLKHARYDTSCRLLAARCLLVQNSLTRVSTMMGRFARPTLVTALAVWRPFHLNARSSRRTAGVPLGGLAGTDRTEAARVTEPIYRYELHRSTEA